MCSRDNRIVVKGTFVNDGKMELNPDIGYSYCNCRDIFYTRKDNVWEPVELKRDDTGIITYPDPFFAWPDPYKFEHWDVRKYEILWDMDALADEYTSRGFNVLERYRDFDVHSKTPQHFHIRVEL